MKTNKIILELTLTEAVQLQDEFIALNQQGCLDKEFYKEQGFEYDAKYVKIFNLIYSKINNGIKEYHAKERIQCIQKNK